MNEMPENMPTVLHPNLPMCWQ